MSHSEDSSGVSKATPLEINLTAAIVAVEDEVPLILTARTGDDRAGLPSGPFDALNHRTLEMGLRSWVREQTDLDTGYVEQLYTFGDRGRHALPGDTGPHIVSVGYLALAFRPEAEIEAAGARFRPWYSFFPWEDWRESRPAILDQEIIPQLTAWAARAPTASPERAIGRLPRLRLFFGLGDASWDEERVLDRYELLYEAGLVEESRRDGRDEALARRDLPKFGEAMRFDHRRILATAMSRLRGKLKYQPLVFEMMPPEFTLTELQRTVEAISGRHLHKQNFRRLVEASALVEPTGGTATGTGGRPAQLFQFRRSVKAERPALGLRLRAKS